LEHVDSCLEEVLEVLRARDARVFVTADHGNAEYMLSPDGAPNTAHTTNPVYLVYVGGRGPLREGAGLSDLAPTVLQLLGVAVPDTHQDQPSAPDFAHDGALDADFRL